VRFGAYHIFIPILLKPAPAALATLLWALKNDQMEAEGLVEIPQISAAGRTSVAVDEKNLPEFYRLSGFRILGKKAVRVDILERLADLIRPCIMWREGGETPRPEGGFEGTGFLVTPAMMSILGATHEDMNEILTTLGYRADVKPEEFVQNRLVAIDPAYSIPETAVKVEKADIKDVADGEVKAPDNASEPQMEKPAEEAVEEEKKIQIWRPAKSGRPQGSRSNATPGKSQGSPKQHRTPHKKGHQGKGSMRGKPVNTAKHKSTKPLDPDSPFAKLAALKARLEGKNG
jgi:ATP-dependent RNA helicase SUPV3L1/SUV3